MVLNELPFQNLDNESFELVINEMSNGSMGFDSDRFACLKLNPLSLDRYKNLSLSQNLDPDSNFFSDVFNCD